MNWPFLNDDLDAVATMLRHPDTVMGLADAGAHVGLIMDSSQPTFLLTYWVRDQGLLSVGEAIRRLSSEPAQLFDLADRGALVPGAYADVNVIDLDGLGLPQPEYVYDYPAGAGRYVQRARGYEWTIVNGEVFMEHGRHAGALAGRGALTRGASSLGRMTGCLPGPRGVHPLLGRVRDNPPSFGPGRGVSTASSNEQRQGVVWPSSGLATASVLGGAAVASASTSTKVHAHVRGRHARSTAEAFGLAEVILEELEGLPTSSCSYEGSPDVPGVVEPQLGVSIDEAKTKKQAKKAIKSALDQAKIDGATPESVRVAGQKATYVPAVDLGGGAGTRETLTVVRGKIAVTVTQSFADPATSKDALIALAEPRSRTSSDG